MKLTCLTKGHEDDGTVRGYWDEHPDQICMYPDIDGPYIERRCRRCGIRYNKDATPLLPPMPVLIFALLWVLFVVVMVC